MLAGEAHEHEGATVVDLAIPTSRTRARAYTAAHGLPSPTSLSTRARHPGLHLGVSAFQMSAGVAVLATTASWMIGSIFVAQGVFIGGVGIARVMGRRALPATGRGAFGVVVGGDELVSPVTSRPCAAFHVELSRDWRPRRALSLRYGRTSDLTIEMDDGRTVRVPAGSVRLSPPPPRRSFNATASASVLRRVVQWVDPQRRNGDDVIEYDRLHERCLQVGDRVVVDNELVPAAPSGDDMTGHAYRDAAPAVLAPSGVPRLAMVKGRRR